MIDKKNSSAAYVIIYELVTLHDDVIKWKHFPRYWHFVLEINRSPVNPPDKGQRRGALMFSLVFAWINGWVSNREAGDLRRHGAHYDAIIMMSFGLEHRGWEFSHSYGAGKSSLPYQTQVGDKYQNLWGGRCVSHEDVIKWKHFPRNWPFVRGIHRSRWIPHTKASDAELWCFLWFASE